VRGKKNPVDLDSLPAAKFDFVTPMLAKPALHLPHGKDWIYEIKLDGYRALVVNRMGIVTLFSRRGNKLNARFPKIAESFGRLPHNTVIDGEIVSLDDRGHPSFAALQNSQSRRESLYFYAFDLLKLRGKDVRGLPLKERRRLLEEAIARLRHPVKLSLIFNGEPSELLSATREQGLEGIIAKRIHSSYESGERSGAWLKFKTNKGQELVIGGYKPGSNGFESLLVGYYESKKLLFVAKIKNGFTPALRRKLAERLKTLETKTCPFANLPERKHARRGEALTREVMQKMRWLKPKLVAQIEFTEWTTNNHLRHSKFVGLRDDKRAHEVVRELI